MTNLTTKDINGFTEICHLFFKNSIIIMYLCNEIKKLKKGGVASVCLLRASTVISRLEAFHDTQSIALVRYGKVTCIECCIAIVQAYLYKVPLQFTVPTVLFISCQSTSRIPLGKIRGTQ